jgi:hypothetical protein
VVAAGWPATSGQAATFTCGSGDVSCLITSINLANANGKTNTIRLAAGVYSLTTADNEVDGPTGLPLVTGRLSVVGAGADLTSLERAAGANVPPFRILDVSATGTVTLRGVTIRNGVLPSSGGPFYGAGVLAAGTLAVIDSAVADNNAPPQDYRFGGGIAGGAVVVIRSTIARNRATTGAGIYIGAGGSLTVENSTIAQNFAYGVGGGVYIGPPDGSTSAEASVTIQRSTIADNQALRGGGGISASGGTLILSESTVARNFGLYAGGGISAARVTVRNSTIVENESDFGPANSFAMSTTLENTIVAHNYSRPAPCLEFTSLGHNVIANPAQPPCQPQSTDITSDPGLGAYLDPGRPGTGHYPLLAGSPAIDAGTNDACGLIDQVGLTRPIDGNGDGQRICDIGAVEFYPVVTDLVSIERVRTDYVPPDPNEVNPLAPGGAYRIEMTYRNGDSMPLCNLAFEVTTLTQSGYAPPVLLDESGGLIGYQGIALPASLAGGKDALKPHQQDKYLFTIGVVSQNAPFVLDLNVLGESTVSRCDGR